MASTNKAGKRKRNYIETYNDLHQAELINSDEEQEEGWVSENLFVV